MALITVSNISKTYLADPIFQDLSFRIEPGEKIGLIGNNGSGKTTIMSILADQLGYEEGQITFQKDLQVGYLSQQVHIESHKTIYLECLEVFEDLIAMEEKIRQMERDMAHYQGQDLEDHMDKYAHLMEDFEARGGYSWQSQIRGTLTGLGFTEKDLDQEASTLSGGQKSRLALAKLLLQKPDLLLLDEPTNHLDIEAISWLEKFLADFRGAVLLISHDRYFLDHIVNRILLLEGGKIFSYKGDYSTYMRKRKADLEERARAYANQQKEIKRQEEIIKRYTSWNRERSLKAARSRQKMLDKIDRLEDVDQKKKATIYFEPKRQSGKDVLLAQNLAKSFGDKELFKNVDFPIYKGERVGLIGPNGVGKTTLMKMILDQTAPSGGQLQIGTGVEVGYFDQEMMALDDSKTVLEEVWDKYPDLDQYQIRTYLAQFLFTGDDLLKEVADLSGGEKGRLSLLELMLSKANFLLLDEPTNHLDIDSKEILEDALNRYTGTILTISHDRYFLNNVATKIIALSPEGALIIEGNYDYYLQKLEELKTPEEETTYQSRTEKEKAKKETKESRKEERKRQSYLRDLEKAISDLETAIKEIDHTLSLPETYEDHQVALDLSKEREEKQASLEGLYEEWMENNEG